MRIIKITDRKRIEHVPFPGEFNDDMIDDLLKEIEELKKDHELLKDIYYEIGPNGYGYISDETRYKLQRFFNDLE